MYLLLDNKQVVFVLFEEKTYQIYRIWQIFRLYNLV